MLADFVYTARRFLPDTPPVITHNEPYASHIFVENGKIALIDWENVAWGHRLHDLSILWMRLIDREDWRDRLYGLLEADGYLESRGERMVWDLEILVQSIANLNYFHFNPMPDPLFGQKANDFFVANIATIIERYK